MRSNNTAEHLPTHAIESTEQCKILVTMQASARRWWTPRELGRELRLSMASTVRALERLAAHGLLEVRLAADMAFRVSPVSPQLAEAVKQLAELYRTNRVHLLSRIRRPATSRSGARPRR